MKKCSRCGAEKQLDQFYRDRRGVYSARCKDCHGLGERTCGVCGKKFEGRTGNKFCSADCRHVERPQTFRDCEWCGKRFGPVDRLSVRFCTYACKVEAQRTGQTVRFERTKEAGRAHRKIAYRIATGKVVRPEQCEECRVVGKKIEAAHYDYSKPEKVRWLCRSCHVKWDRGANRGGTVRIAI